MFDFATGVINVWEKKILDKLDQARMLKAPDRESAFSVLFDTDLGEIASLIEDIEKIFENDLDNLKKNFSKILENSGLVVFLFLKFDAFNVKIALKKYFFPNETKDVFPFSFASEPYENIEKKIFFLFSKQSAQKIFDSHSMPKCACAYVEKMIQTAAESLKKLSLPEINSSIIEEAVDKTYFQLKIDLAKCLSSFLTEIIKLEIDVANIKSFVRAKKGFELIDGGNLKKSEIESILTLKEAGIGQSVSKFLEVLKLSYLAKDFLKGKSEISFQKDLESFISEKIFIKERSTSSGIEKILAFFYKKLNSHCNIRLILFAKENNLPIEEIEELLLPI